MPTLDLQDGLEPTSSPSRSRLSGGLSQRVDRRYLVGCVAGVLLGGALAVPAAYALLRASPARDNGAVGRGESLSTLMSAGLDALARKDDARALELFRRATQAFPKNAPAHNNVCVALNELGRHPDEHIDVEWLGEERATAAVIQPFGRRALRVPGDEQDGHSRALVPQTPHHLAPAQLRHDDVAHDERDLVAALGPEIQSLEAVLALEHREAIATKHARHGTAHLWLILDEEDDRSRSCMLRCPRVTALHWNGIRLHG